MTTPSNQYSAYKATPASGGRSNKYALNVIWAFIEKGLRIVAQLVVGIWVARYLQPERFGVLQYSLSFVLILGAFGSLGLLEIVTRELINKSDEKIRTILGTGLVVRVIGAFFAVAFINLVAFFTESDSDIRIYILILSVGRTISSFELLQAFFKARVKIRAIAIGQFWSLMFFSLLKIFLVVYEYPLEAFIYVYALDGLLAAGVMIFFLRRDGFPLLQLNFKKKVAGKLLRSSYHLMLSVVMIQLYGRIDQVIIGNLMDDAAVGYYSTAARLFDAWNFLPVALCGALFPAIMSVISDTPKLRNRLTALYSINLYIGIFISLGMNLLAEWMVTTFFGEAYLPAVPALRLLTFAICATFLGVATEQFLIAKGLTHLSLLRTLIGAALNIALNFVLIPMYGIEGAAIATVISYYSGIILSLGLFKASRGQLLLLLNAFNPMAVISLVKIYLQNRK